MPDHSTIPTIATALEALRSGDLTPQALASACLERIERLNPTLSAFITVPAVIANPEAVTQSRAGADRLPLEGIPIAVKDLYDTADLLTTAGTPFFKDRVPAEDAAVVQKIKAAGAVVIGKTNTHEIALGLTGINPHFGTCRNPWDTARVSGGSSSGSAVAVATGMCLAALGTDTGGSIRVPAALCGVVGLKPTYGRVSLRGILPLSWNLDHAGPLTRTVRDAALMLQVIAGHDPADPVSVDVPADDYLGRLEDGARGLRVALGAGEYFEGADPEVREAVREAAAVLARLGADVRAVDIDFMHEAAHTNTQIVIADAAAVHRERLVARPGLFGEDVRQRLEMGRAITSTDYILHRRTQTEMRRRMDMLFEEYDLLLTPTTPNIAPLIESSDAVEQARRLTRFTSTFNLTGLPALSLPCGFSQGLPVGLQIVGPAWSEARVLRAAHAYEGATTWHTKNAGL